MQSSKSGLIGLLAGASVLALAAVSAPAAAEIILSGANASVDITTDTDYVIIDNTFSATGDVTNSARIGDIAPSSQGFYVDPAAVIEGSLINDVTGEIHALSASTSSAAVTGLSVVGNGVASIINDGLIQASASATGLDATAQAFGAIYRQGDAGFGSAIAGLTNGGDLIASADGFASSSTSVSAIVDAVGLVHAAGTAANASVALDNSGNISADANASATATWYYALASASATGVNQIATGDGSVGSVATAIADNTGSISASASADGNAYYVANATAFAVGVNQNAGGADIALASLTNGVDISATATASAYASLSWLGSGATAYAGAAGVVQLATALSVVGSSAVADLVNTGSILASAEAHATLYSSGAANASAYATGVAQSADGAQTLVTTLDNAGSITAIAEASASAFSFNASALAFAAGVSQTLGTPAATGTVSAAITNSGEISAKVAARVNGLGNASANASGVFVDAGADVDIAIDNDGTISAAALATDDSTAVASAHGVNVTAAGVVTGSILNSGTILATASANATLTSPAGSFFSGSASATAVAVAGSEFTGTISNTGTLAATALGYNSWATGIRIAGGGAGAGTGTIVNDGGIIEATYDTGNTVQRGDAINVQDASNAIAIELKGSVSDGQVIGNIELSDDDAVYVTSGNTYLTGNVNNDGLQEGDLTINGGGALWLQHGGTSLGGPSIVTVANYAQGTDGTVAIGVADDGSSGQINGGTVSLAGSMVVTMNAGLYDDVVEYQDIVTSVGPIATVWDTVSSFSPLMTADVIYNANDADLYVTRVAFDDVDGLTRNQRHVASGFENAYFDPENAQAFDDLTGELFTLDPAAYAAALDSLSGVEHAVAGQQVMRSFRNLDGVLSGVQGRDCQSGSGSYATSRVEGGNTITPVADLDVVDCDGASLWLRGQGLWANADGTSNSPGFDSTELSVYGGVDYTMSTGTTLGALLGYVSTDIDFSNGNDADFDGYQIGVYGQQSWEAFYVQGLVAYGSAGVDVTRDIAVGTILGTSKSDYNDDVWYLNGEMGYDWAIGTDGAITSFAGLSYANLNGDNFDEDGLDGANLEGSVDGESLVSALGFRIGGDWGSRTTHYFRPELSLAWEHEFGNFTSLDANFIGAPASGFSVTGGDYGRDAAVVEAGFAVGSETVEFKLNYTGRWTADYDDQAVYGQLSAKF